MSTYAIIEEGGGQRKVAQGDEFLADLRDQGSASVGAKVTFDKVLVIGGEGQQAKIGRPYVAGAKVQAEVVEAVVLGPKLTVQYFQPKKGSRRRTGHRQRFTRLKITAING